MTSPTGSDVEAQASRVADKASDMSKRAADTASGTVDNAKESAAAAMTALKEQAGQAADEAKTTIAAVADEAKSRLVQIVDDKKSEGADQVAGLARAAQAAAGDLRENNPQLARLFDSAAERVDGIADDIRSSSLAEMLSSLSAFGRRQPVALFGGAVVAGFLLARFVKSDAPPKVASRSGPGRRRL